MEKKEEGSWRLSTKNRLTTGNFLRKKCQELLNFYITQTTRYVKIIEKKSKMVLFISRCFSDQLHLYVQIFENRNSHAIWL